MYHPAAVCFVEGVGDLHPELENLLEQQWAFFEALCEWFAFDALHH